MKRVLKTNENNIFKQEENLRKRKRELQSDLEKEFRFRSKPLPGEGWIEFYRERIKKLEEWNQKQEEKRRELDDTKRKELKEREELWSKVEDQCFELDKLRPILQQQLDTDEQPSKEDLRKARQNIIEAARQVEKMGMTDDKSDSLGKMDDKTFWSQMYTISKSYSEGIASRVATLKYIHDPDIDIEGGVDLSSQAGSEADFVMENYTNSEMVKGAVSHTFYAEEILDTDIKPHIESDDANYPLVSNIMKDTINYLKTVESITKLIEDAQSEPSTPDDQGGSDKE